MERKLIFLLFIIMYNFGYTQNFIFILSPGDEAFNKGNFKEAIKYYKLDLAKQSKNKDDSVSTEVAMYNLFASFSLLKQIDSAYRYLNIFLDTYKYDDKTTPKILTDGDLFNLYYYDNKRWNTIQDKVLKHYLLNTQINRNLVKTLFDMGIKDQAFYHEISYSDKKIQDSLWNIKSKFNIDNQQTLDSLISINGYPNHQKVGSSASEIAFLIIQHADIEYQKKYIGLLKKQSKKNKIDKMDFAMLYDRICIKSNKPQKYGTQIFKQDTIYVVFPVKNEKKVDKYRKEVGLLPEKDYLKIYFNQDKLIYADPKK